MLLAISSRGLFGYPRRSTSHVANGLPLGGHVLVVSAYQFWLHLTHNPIGCIAATRSIAQAFSWLSRDTNYPWRAFSATHPKGRIPLSSNTRTHRCHQKTPIAHVLGPMNPWQCHSLLLCCASAWVPCHWVYLVLLPFMGTDAALPRESALGICGSTRLFLARPAMQG